MYDLRNFIASVEETVRNHELEPGLYRRWSIGDRDDGQPNPYGCADAANILYTIGAFHHIRQEESAWIAGLCSLQDRDTGMFNEATHSTIHTTAHCLAALELFDERSPCPLKGLAKWNDPELIGIFLDDLDWDNPWGASHKGAGIYAALVLAGEASQQWQEAYFRWLWNETCPETGFWRKGHVTMVGQSEETRGVFPHLAGSFHYLFNHEYARMSLRYPERVIDSSLTIFREKLWPSLGSVVGFAEVDWVYCITRALRQCGYRRDDCMRALRDFTDLYLDYLHSLDFATDVALNDLHALFGAMCCLAELQTALPNTLKTDIPLKLVLDRRPFI